MKTHATFRYFLITVSLAAVLAAQTPDGRAGDKQPAAAKAADEGFDLVISDGGLWEPNRPGEQANLSSAVNWLRRRYTNSNFAFEPELADLEISGLKLRAHDLRETLEAFRVASGYKFDWTPPVWPPGQIRTGGSEDMGLFVLRKPVQTGQVQQRVVEAFNLAPYIERRKSETNPGMNEDENMRFADEMFAQVNEIIIQTAASFRQVGADEMKKELKFQFHPGAKLLIVVGPVDDVDVARKVVSALTGQIADGKMGLSSAYVAAEAEPVSVEAIPAQNAELSSVYAAAMSLLKDKRSKVVLSDERSKTLIVMATKSEVAAIKKAMEELGKAGKPYVGDFPDGRAPARK